MHRIDSRLIQPGDTFVCLPNAEAHVPAAMAAGAREVIRLSHEALGPFAKELYGDPSQDLTVIGVTGTNGKTTTTHLIHHGLTQTGRRSALVGTINAPLTTPDILDISRRMADHRQANGTHFVMEVSSHAIAQNRIDGITFFCRILTNITQDHLDYHGTFEAYKATKLRFMAGPGHALFPDSYEAIPLAFHNPLAGRFNERNMQAAIAALRLCGISDTQLNQVMPLATAPPGRFERVIKGQPFDVIVDYAHTPDGMENVLAEARHMANDRGGRVITVFGCGGDRDRTKRPLMAQAAVKTSEVVVITSDNPRTEDPQAIVTDILTGIASHPNVTIHLDRRDAIRHAIQTAQPHDVVMVLGKGHEKTQVIGQSVIHFDDVEEVGLALAALSEGKWA